MANMAENVLSIDLQLFELKRQDSLSPAEMRQQAEHIQAAAERIQYPHGITEAMLFLAHLLWADMDFPRASRIIKQAIQLAKNDGALNLLADAYHLSALIHVAKGRYTPALSQWLHCLKLMRCVQEERLYIDVLIGFGNLWTIDQQNEKAQFELKHALEHALRIQSKPLAAKAAICLSREQLKLGHFEEALASLDQAETSLSTLNNPTWLAEIYNYRARAWLALGKPDQAHAHCLHAWQSVANQSHLVWAQCLTLVSLAQIALAKQTNPLEDLNQASHLAEQYHLQFFLSQIALIRSQYAEKQGLWNDALASFKQYRQYDLGELAQHQQQGRRDFSSIQFMRLAQQIEVQREKNANSPQATAPLSTQPHNALPRYVWLQRLTSYTTQNTEYGVVFIRLPSHSEHFPAQRKMYLLAAMCTEHSVFCQYAANLYAIAIPTTTEKRFAQYQDNLRRVLTILPLDTKDVGIAATLGRPGQTLHELITQIETPLFAERV
ncbi:hypothetical protein [Deefgea rivuli]|uniref:hypothetical protein n=1 Tax=Deefgea rivuli TaxID=400948 RepID=UPI0004813465|nr:hypothetical protein [Deefgea rivuli]